MPSKSVPDESARADETTSKDEEIPTKRNESFYNRIKSVRDCRYRLRRFFWHNNRQSCFTQEAIARRFSFGYTSFPLTRRYIAHRARCISRICIYLYKIARNAVDVYMCKFLLVNYWEIVYLGSMRQSNRRSRATSFHNLRPLYYIILSLYSSFSTLQCRVCIMSLQLLNFVATISRMW